MSGVEGYLEWLLGRDKREGDPDETVEPVGARKLKMLASSSPEVALQWAESAVGGGAPVDGGEESEPMIR